jgi:hypothetical protein
MRTALHQQVTLGSWARSMIFFIAPYYDVGNDLYFELIGYENV